MYQDLVEKKKTLAVIGLGYVGLPIALLFAKKIKVIGFDINSKRIEMIRNKIDPSCELGPEEFDGCDIYFTDKIEDLKNAHFFVVAVPTPIDKYNKPDLTPVLSASRTVAQVLKKGDYVVYESTVYPGCTEEDCIPILETSGLKYQQDFKVGYSPERINPGDKEHTLANTVKVVSGCCPESLENIAKTYELVITAGVHRASSIKVAESAKIIENTQRDLNIALMNELSIIFNKMGINTYEVLEAAGTKWNFLKFKPGLVGGHCIGVDPYYLVYKAEQLGVMPRLIATSRSVNDGMPEYVAKNCVSQLIQLGKDLSKSKILVMGVTFKEDVTDIRNSKVADVVYALKSYHLNVEIVDPLADNEEVQHEYGFSISKNPTSQGYDAIIVAVSHKEYIALNEDYFKGLISQNGLLMDLKGIYRNKFKNLNIWSL